MSECNRPTCGTSPGGICADRQLGYQFSNSYNLSIPAWLPGITMGNSFIHFKWDCSLKNPCDYTVVVQANDASGAPYRSLGSLRHTVHLPDVWFEPNSQIGVIPKDRSLPAFQGILHRGSTYFIPSTNGQNGVFPLEQFGKY